MTKEDELAYEATCDIVDQGHSPEVERLLLELELNLNFLKFLEERDEERRINSEKGV
tara:strand:- start:148 stop:318 length:171 start_codon:yes stop_codon:yes gene_type:complete